MTKKEIDQMRPGREMDATVHRTVFNACPHPEPSMLGWECRTCGAYTGRRGEDSDTVTRSGGYSCPSYSEDIAAAWQIVETIKSSHPIVLTFRPVGKDWWCMLPDESKHPKGQKNHGPDCVTQAFGESAPLAICRAALKIKNQERQ